MKTRTRVGPLAGRAVAAPELDVDALLDDPGTGIIVCCGSGGVGKTTTSAALALRAAEQGRKVVVLTIDPARRLAQSMGIEALLAEGRHHAERRRLEDSQRALIDALDVPSYELPLLPGGIDMAGLYELAEALTEEGMS